MFELELSAEVPHDFVNRAENSLVCLMPYCDENLFNWGYKLVLARDDPNFEKNQRYLNPNTAENFQMRTSTTGTAKFKCYICQSPSHMATNCPGKSFKGGKMNPAQMNVNFMNRKKGKKICPECGAEGRHPKASSCSLSKKKKKEDYDEYVFVN